MSRGSDGEVDLEEAEDLVEMFEAQINPPLGVKDKQLGVVLDAYRVLQQDAARWRWLRESGALKKIRLLPPDRTSKSWRMVMGSGGLYMDDAVDEAIQAGK